MKHPNLTAEYEATGNHICTLANHAGTTEELMSDILYGDESVMLNESFALCRLFGVSLEYLFAPELTVLNPNEEKTISCAAALRQAIEEADKLDMGTFDATTRETARKVYADMQEGKPVTYAAYRNSLEWMKLLVAADRKRNGPRRGRTSREGVA